MDPFDEFAQALARGVSRRQALRMLAGGVAGAIVASVIPWRSPSLAFAGAPDYQMSGASVPSALSMAPSFGIGDGGQRVEAIQLLLRQHGVGTGKDIVIDGDFGEQTEQAVHDFQAGRGLNVDGVVSPQTWGALFITVKKGSKESDAVSAAQTLLNMHGQEIPVDGDFGDVTDGAVKAFQRDKKITANGTVGTPTWLALVSR